VKKALFSLHRFAVPLFALRFVMYAGREKLNRCMQMNGAIATSA
jgi:hypothetical protein